jgi:ABC-type cobalamin/Fe3+-siderophores transport system ATPase subunit
MFILHLQGTLLVLDEPTNHLDIPSKEMLEEAIRAFEGAVIAVSHDRYFLKQIATRVLLVRRSWGKTYKCVGVTELHLLVCPAGHWGLDFGMASQGGWRQEGGRQRIGFAMLHIDWLHLHWSG